ncbi:hypothetical protein KBY84_10730 [Cyanobium sp. N.Huapi 1H5]|uniref:PEP/pyruvate-binding domain-containing protein n=1 Tax=Cyanobium sp. N.Huapi 1H5 TaxID=2823719 RepID=UPI0020CE6BCD|nr:PEP/pyruvate-binding domain-containing protein [Cyanobium sp. N.Huapi 1H5]MCP9837967.1 hypothetical protein [Cyanobium sp. N.Huapi 1H5]
MSRVVPLEAAEDLSCFGAKAVGLGQALRDGLPVPSGFALAADLVEAVASGDDDAIAEVLAAVGGLSGPLAVRSSAIDEDGAAASFAGQHLTLLNVPSLEALAEALRAVWWSANSDSAISYRKRVGLFSRPSVGVVVQTLLSPVSAGVMFTRNPVTGVDERVIEASWGLGEAVVAGLVIPDHICLDRAGMVRECRPGYKTMAIRPLAGGGTRQETLASELVERLCLDDAQLQALNRLALRCEEVYGPGRDLEWAFADDGLVLLQCRAITKAGP